MHTITKYFAILNQPYQLLMFQVEDPCDEVMPVSAALTFKEAVLNVFPLWVTGEGDEQIRPTELANIGHSILSSLMHVPWRASET